MRTTICFFLFRIHPIVHTPLSVDIELGTLPYIHGEPKTPHWFGESTRVFKRHTSTALVPTSSVFQFSEHKLVRIHLHYPLVILLLILTVFSIMILLLPFIKVNTLAYLTFSLALYLIHTCLLPLISLFLF